jgi:hypothetical protein
MNKKVAILMAITLMVGIISPLSILAQTKTTSAGIYGTMTATNDAVMVGTQITNPQSSARVYTSYEVRNNATGGLLESDSWANDYGRDYAGFFLQTSYSVKVAVYGAHEVRGSSSYALYTVETRS